MVKMSHGTTEEEKTIWVFFKFEIGTNNPNLQLS